MCRKQICYVMSPLNVAKFFLQYLLFLKIFSWLVIEVNNVSKILKLGHVTVITPLFGPVM